MKKLFICLLLISISVSMASPSFASLVIPATSKTSEPDPAKVKAALAEFKNLSKKERKERIKDAKNEWKHFKKEKKENRSAKVEEAVLIILAILLPPLAVYLHQGEVNGKFWLSLLLWFLGFIPGIVYALLVVTDSL